MSELTSPFVSIITLNYNQATVTKDFLESTLTLTYDNYEILVCDMGSKEDPLLVIPESKFPKAKFLYSRSNLGFAGGNNWGMKQAMGEYIFLVNNDTIVTPDLLTKLIAPFYQDNSIGITCPKIRYFYQPDLIEYAGFRQMNKLTGRTRSIGQSEIDNGQYDTSRATSSAHGCAMMVKKKVIEKVGMLPEKFFLYYEEWDWSVRIINAGFKVWYTSEALIYHKGSVTIGKSNPLQTYYLTRNRILFMRRHSTRLQLFVFGLFFSLVTIPVTTTRYILKKEFTNLKYFLKGIAWNLYSSSYSRI